MADLGGRGSRAEKTYKAAATPQAGFITSNPVRCVVIGRTRMPLGLECLTDGSPTSPCLELSWAGTWRLRWPVAAGARTFSIDCKNLSGLTPYPKVTIRANPGLGVAADVVGNAVAGTGWQTIGPLSVTPTSQGVLLVELSCGLSANNPRAVRWDNVQKT